MIVIAISQYYELISNTNTNFNPNPNSQTNPKPNAYNSVVFAFLQ